MRSAERRVASTGHTVRNKHIYYRCKGLDQIVSLCDLPSVNGEMVDAIVWGWVRMIIEDPENLRLGLVESQGELRRANQALIDRLSIIDDQLQENQKQLAKLLDLYLHSDFSREILAERKSRLEGILGNLGQEKDDLVGHLRRATISDDQLAYIENFCAKIRCGLEQADFNAKRHIVELLDIRGKIAFENNEKVVYLRCLTDPNGQQPVSRVQISPSSNAGTIGIWNISLPQASRFVSNNLEKGNKHQRNQSRTNGKVV